MGTKHEVANQNWLDRAIFYAGTLTTDLKELDKYISTDEFKSLSNDSQKLLIKRKEAMQENLHATRNLLSFGDWERPQGCAK